MSDYLAYPKSTPRGGILVLHAWWGLNDFFKGLCERLADEGYIALAPDLYNGAIAGTIPEAEKLSTKLKQETTSKKILQSLKQLQVETKQPIGLIGFSLGAYWGLRLLEEKPKAFSATVLFYGTRGGEYAKTKSAFLGHFAENDPYESPESVKQLERDLRAAGRAVTFYTYPGTGHWFFETDQADAYNAGAAQLAWTRTVEFLRNSLSED